jgi:serine/threonine-protein kinase
MSDIAYWRRIDELLDEALSLPAAERTRWLESLSGEDAKHREVLAAMLARASGGQDAFMGQPVAAATVEAASERVTGDKPGEIVGGYRLIEPLGAGGMATVWSAERADGSVQRRVALKLPRSGWSPGLAERLKRECEILSALEHPNIGRLYDAGLTDAGRPYLAMEQIDGLPIDEYCRKHALPIRARLGLFLQVARAVTFAHARLIVHRDLKPSNILVDREGRVHLVDFGLGKLLAEDSAEPAHLTQMTGRALTPAYASPEQIRGEAVTVATDVYSLGVVLYELLTGARPYRLKRDTPAALEDAIMEADVPPASSQVADPATKRLLRGDLDTILAKALKKDVAQRYATVEAFATDVDRHLRALPVTARPDSFLYIVGKFMRRHRGIVTAGVLLGAAVIAGAGATLYQARVAEREAARAQAERDRALRELRFAEAAEGFMRFLMSEQSTQPLPAAELMRRAEAAASQRYPGDPRVRARMQIIVAELYSQAREYGRAEEVLREARRSAEAAGDMDTVAYADCTLGGLLFPLGRNSEGMALLDGVIAGLEAPGSAADATVRATCYQQRAAMNRQAGKADDAARDARAALAAMGEPRPGQEVNRAFLGLYLAYPLIKAGRMGEALEIFGKARSDLIAAGQGNTTAGYGITSNYFSLLVHAGQLRRAQEVYDEVIRELGGKAPATPFNTVYASLLLWSGRTAEAQAVAEETAAVTSAKGDKSGEAHSLLWAALAACAEENYAKCGSFLDRVEATLRPVLAPGHPTFNIVDTTKASILMSQQRDTDAIELLRQVTARLGSERSPHLVRALSRLAMAEQRAGHPAEAKASAQRAVEVARSAMAGLQHSEFLGSALLAQARIAAEQGEADAAKTLLAQAREELRASIGEGAR